MKTLYKNLIKIIGLFLLVIWGLMVLFPKPSLLNYYSFSTAIYDEQKQLLRLTLSEDQKYRLYKPLKEISSELIQATLLQEDQYFYWHLGINPLAILKASWQTYVLKSRRMGASTITMQLARIRYGINTKKISGKIWQIILALNLELHFSKNEILEAYLNLAPYGSNIEGVGAASLIYFNKNSKDLNLAQSLVLSVIPQNPSKRISSNKNLLAIRNKLASRWMLRYPKDKNKRALLKLPLEMQGLQDLAFGAPHFVNSVLKETYPEREVITTLDNRIQRILKRVSSRYLNRKKDRGVTNTAILVVDTRDLGVKGLIGSADFFNQSISGQINGTEIKRSPGSTLKPFIYGLALDQGLIHPNTVLKDVPHSFGSYNPENFDYEFMGPLKAKDALVLSRNIPAIYLESQLKPNLNHFLEQAEVSQLKPESYYGLALSLGGAELSMKELSSLYALLANDGKWFPLRTRQEQTLGEGRRLLSPEASFLLLDILKNTPRPEGYEKENFPVSWKTGTSSGYRDAWAVGIFGPYVLTVWLGNFSNQANPAFVGKNLAAPLFFEIIAAIRQELNPLPTLEKGSEFLNLTRLEVCKASGLLPTRYCQDREYTWFIPGKSPIKTDQIYREIAINKSTGLRTCHINENTGFEIYEFWSSDLLNIFKQAGISRRTPPPFESDCDLNQKGQGISPQISSPKPELTYIIRANSSQKMTIPFTAITDADVEEIFWFINGSFLAKTPRDKAFLWQAKAGKYVVRVVDDHGRSDAQDILIEQT